MSTVAERLAALESAVAGPGRDAAIRGAMEDRAGPVRERAIRLAARYLEPAVLAEMVADGGNAVRRNSGLSALERQGPYAVAHLTGMLAGRDPELIMFALQCLSRIGYAPAGPAILPLLRHPDPNVAQAAIEAVGDLRVRDAVPALLQLLHGDLWLQLAAINALGAIGAPEAVAPLLALVPDSVLAEPAVQALGSLASPESLEPLLLRLPAVRERALRDPLLLAIAVVIDLHPEPEPAIARTREGLAGSVELLARLGEILQAEPDAGPDGDSLQRAAATLVVAARLDALEPLLLVRLHRDPGAAWLQGMFHRFPLEPASRHAYLIDPDPDVRGGALRVVSVGLDELPLLTAALQDGEPAVRAAACAAFERLALDATAPLLIERLRRGEPVERAAAAGALARLSPEALGELAACLEPAMDEAVVTSALEVLAARPVAALDARVLRLAEDARPAVRRAGLRAAARVPGSRTDVLLLRALADRDQTIQVEALELLVGRGGDRAVAVLAAMLGTTDSLRFHVIRALGLCRARSAAPRLRSLFPECAPHEQLQIVAALIRIAPPWIAEFLRDRLAEPEIELRRVAAQGLADLAPPDELRVLLPLADDPDWRLRNEAARGLVRLGSRGAVRALLTLARDVEPVVAATARALLDQLPPEAVRIPA